MTDYKLDSAYWTLKLNHDPQSSTGAIRENELPAIPANNVLNYCKTEPVAWGLLVQP